MKPHWRAAGDKLMYSGIGFLGFVQPSIGLSHLEWHFWIKELKSNTSTPYKTSLDISTAVKYIENFFEQSYSEQVAEFKKYCKEPIRATRKAYLIIGPSYCGKTEFIKKETLIRNIFSLGDYFRNIRQNNSIAVSPEALKMAMVDCMRGHEDDKIVVFDNAFKNVEQAKVAIGLLEKYREIEVYCIDDTRSNVDITTRGRIDDSHVEEKQQQWRDDWPELKKYLMQLYNSRKIGLTYILNTDVGFKYFDSKMNEYML